MFSENASKQLESLFANALVRFADAAPDVTDPPASAEEALEHGASSGAAAPFHFALFPEIVRFKMLERSFSSALGSTFEEAALIIGRDRFAYAQRAYPVQGRIRATVSGQIEQLITDYETVTGPGTRARTPDGPAERRLIESLHGEGGEDRQDVVDLFLRGHDDSEHYFHMKTVKPNRDQSSRGKRLLLRVYAMRLPRRVHTFLGMAYNPYGEGGSYGWGMPKPYFDFHSEVLIGRPFWDYVGGHGAFTRLLDVARTAGSNAHETVVKTLGL